MGVLKLSNRNFQKINENVQNIPCGKSMPCGGVIYAYEYCFLGSHPSRGSSIYQARRANNWKNGFFVAPKAPRKISEHSFRNFREIRKEKCNKKYFFGWFWQIYLENLEKCSFFEVFEIHLPRPLKSTSTKVTGPPPSNNPDPYNTSDCMQLQSFCSEQLKCI